MTDHAGSTYTVLQNVPVMVSPHYRLPKKIAIASELKPVPDDISQLVAYPFSVERQVIAEVEVSRKKTLEEEEALKVKKSQYEEELTNKRKVAARKIAPGFLDTDTRILKPEQRYIQMPESTEEMSTTVQESPRQSISESANSFDYLKFEQGLAPADPWDTPENDFVALKSVLSSPSKANYNSNSNSHRTFMARACPPYPPRPYVKNEGAYWNVQNGAGYPQPPPPPPSQGLSPKSVPAIPPKPFNNSPLPSSSSSPIISYSSPSLAPPPVPPLPTNTVYEHLIEELNNMGFTRIQAMAALEKNDYDLLKATNFLLDQA
ncbi:hypothetical protein G6F57_009491 [Rhizopus arrhizus]|uniref:UBA domain-containing protein n=1 Tax=Rhizopus oryzae TaxID=64495 RepID=A0A9P6X4J3_RHIOR|nr:hypothetical protein G6F23_008675 [Rhizopus arrhizus]KAG1415367.1 hypothetical protein G6F58_006517 [Rhizopus delemar]KAG0760055.1 hypothetical protein G6F24_008604 [Rhizopus arrhizus]KAG0785129.1 hypothetical protein G6F21_009460 [Rhizopus arrhizus]KAG0799280.1 hypothetical protein G6F22_003387 [Rhizopus arrhizus]